MSAYTGVYAVGEPAEECNEIYFLMMDYEGMERQALIVHYFDTTIKPIGRIDRIRTGPDSDLLDACLVFFPAHFSACPALAAIEQELRDTELLDFYTGPIPDSWDELRKQAKPLFANLGIWHANFNTWRPALPETE